MGKFGINLVRMAVIFLAGTLLVLMIRADYRYAGPQEEHLEKLIFQGTVQADGGEPVECDREALQKAGAAQDLVLRGHFIQQIPGQEQIFVYLRRICVEIRQNGQKIYAYGDDTTHAARMRSGGNVWGSFYSAGIRPEDEIEIRLHNPYRGNSSRVYELFFDRMYAGDGMQLFIHMAEKKLPVILGSLFILLLGVELLFSSATLRMIHTKGLECVRHCGALFITGSLWLLIDYAFISLMIPFPMTIDVIDTLAFIGIPLLAIRYGRDFMTECGSRRMAVVEYSYLAISLAAFVLCLFGVLDGEVVQEMLMSVMPLLLLILFVAMIGEIRHNDGKDAKRVCISGLLLILFGAVSYICYELGNADGAQFFGVGLFLFAVAQFAIMLQRIREIYQQSIRAGQMEKELAESRISVMMSQIQPHFLYNSISCIQELCLIEPEKAYDALAQFARFLRGNMDSLTSKKPIPFEKELSHVRNYLALEKIRFEERLNIRYEICEEGFMIPALTLQPIVENAVRYGISKKKEGGTITISTRRREGWIEVAVEDDGLGFETDMPVADDTGTKRSHVGMENVRKRLESQCGGRLIVESSQGNGSRVSILLPETSFY